MADKIKLQTAVDVSVTTTTPSRFGTTRLYANTEAESEIYFQMPVLPANSTIISAKLWIYAGGALAAKTSGFPTAKIHALTEPFDANNVTWADLPTFNPVAAATKSAPESTVDGLWMFDLSTLIQNVVNGAAWYGVKLVSNSTSFEYWMGTQSQTPMYLEIEYSAAPRVPTELMPRDTQVVNVSKPVLSWNVVASGAGDRPYGFQVQVASSADMLTSLWDSGTVISGVSLLDLSTTSFPAITSGQTRYWRVRVRNEGGAWSDYSVVAPFKFTTPGVVTITGPTSPTPDPTPVITWSVTGTTQKAYQVLIWLGNKVMWDSGIISGTATSIEAPQGIWKYVGDIYYVEVRVWDDKDRTATSQVTTYIKDGPDALQYTPGGTTPVVQIQALGSPPWPFYTIKWQYTDTLPDYFILRRERLGQGAYDIVQSVSPVQSAVPGEPGWFQAVDYWVPGRAEIKWFVQAVKAGVSSTFDSYVVKTVRNNLSWVFSNYYGPTVGFSMVNANIEVTLTEVSDVVQPINGQPFLVSQAFKSYQGSVSAEICDDVCGLTAAEMRRDFLFLRRNPRAVLVWADEAIDCFIFNCNITPNPLPSGKTDYIISFEFVQVGGNF